MKYVDKWDGVLTIEGKKMAGIWGNDTGVGYFPCNKCTKLG